MKVYKSAEGKHCISETCKTIYSQWPIPAEKRTLTTEEFGDTFCLDMGPRTAGITPQNQ